jgi:hypothetical protein
VGGGCIVSRGRLSREGVLVLASRYRCRGSAGIGRGLIGGRNDRSAPARVV